jgi:acyl-CoA thioester hydrolase
MQAEQGRRRRASLQVAVIDLDVHQGNGTARIFREDPSVFTLSMHGQKSSGAARHFPRGLRLLGAVAECRGHGASVSAARLPRRSHRSRANDPMNSRPTPHHRSAFRVFRNIPTRWADNDIYGHVNNVVYYAWFDTAVNALLIERGALDINRGDTIGFVVETQCNYFAPLAFPQTVEAGVRVAHAGSSSVRYEIALFAEGAESAAAQGHFVHVYVDRTTQRPVKLPAALQAVVDELRA